MYQMPSPCTYPPPRTSLRWRAKKVVDLAPLHEDLVQHIPVACVPKLLIKTSTRVARSVLQKKAEGPDSAMRT